MKKNEMKQLNKKSNETKSNGGISMIKPFKGYYNRPKLNKYTIKTQAYIDLVYNQQPFKLFITMTFGVKMDLHQCCTCINTLIHRYNSELFTTKYNKRGDFIKGFAFIEDHKSGRSRNDIHVHMLIKYNERYDEFEDKEHIDKFHKAARNIVDKWGNRVFNDEHLDLQYYRDEGAINYSFKDITDKYLNRFKIIGEGGLSDSIDDQ